jgi:two-component system chemotaxis response regulator CheY
VLHILVVDDNADARDLLATILRAEGYEVSLAADGKEGYERYVALRPALVVADIFMPGLDGIGMIRQIVAADPAARIVAVSAGWNVPNLEVSEELRELDVLALARDAGAIGILRKPIDPDAVAAAVATALARPSAA